MGNARNGEGMGFANNFVRALMSVCSQVSIGQVAAGQALVSRYAGALENRQGGTWKPAYVKLVGRQTRRRADRIVVCELDVREPQIPVVLSFVDDHSQHLGHSVVHPLNAPVAVRTIGACGKLARSQELVYSLCKLGAELQAVIREYGARTPPSGNVFVDQNIGRTLIGKLSGSDGEHICPKTETIGDQQDVGVA